MDVRMEREREENRREAREGRCEGRQGKRWKRKVGKWNKGKEKRITKVKLRRRK